MGPPRCNDKNSLLIVLNIRKKGILCQAKRATRYARYEGRVLSGFEDNNYRKKSCIVVKTSQATISKSRS